MKIRTCWLLFLLGMTAGSAWSQSTGTVYGLIDIGFVHEGGGPGGASIDKLTSGVASGSRLGFRGTEGLGDGLAAFYVLEMGINADTGTLGQGGLGFGRQSIVGLQGDFGTVALGRQYTPVAFIQTETDPFATGLAGNSPNLISAGGAGGSNRMNNTVRYSYTGQSGLTADLAYGFGEATNSISRNRQVGAAIGYVSGPVYLKLGYHNVKDAMSVPAKMTFFGAKYDIGAVTAHFNYVVNKGAAVFGLVNADSRDVMVGMSVPYGASRFMASCIGKNDRTFANNDARQVALGYTYFLSKRTSFYASIARIRNNALAGAASGFYRVGNATEQGLGNRAQNIGVRHAF
jgi:predicted porin